MPERVRTSLALAAAGAALGVATLTGVEVAGAQPDPAATESVTTTTAPPSAPPTVSTTTVPVGDRARITQDTPDLGGVLALWGLGIVGTVATLLWSWWQNGTRPEGGS